MEPEIETVDVPQEPRVYEVPEANLDELRKKIGQLARRAEQLGSKPIILTEVGESFDLWMNAFPYEMDTEKNRFYRQKLNQDETVSQAQERILAREMAWRKRNGIVNDLPEFKITRRVHFVLDGEIPKLAGWTFLAVIEHQNLGNILRSIPPYTKESLPVRFRTLTQWCDHCQAIRNRRDTYIVKREEDGLVQQVGRQCLKDFTGHQNPEAVASMAQWLVEFDNLASGYGDDDFFGGGRGPAYYGLKTVLTVAACVVRLDGFVSKQQSQQAADEGRHISPTSNTVMDVINPPRSNSFQEQKRRRELAERYQITDADKVMVERAFEWAQQGNDHSNDYRWNLYVITGMESITHKHLGLAVSMIGSFKRELDKIAAKKVVVFQKPSEYFGIAPDEARGIKSHIANYTLQLTGEKSMASDFSPSATLYNFIDGEGNVAVWFASRSYEELAIGGVYEIRAKVKAHQDYRGTKQTVLTNAKVMRDLTPKGATA